MTRLNYQRRVAALVAFGHRGSGTKQERLAAEYLAGELRALGLMPQIQPFMGSHSLGGQLLAYILLAATGVCFISWMPLLTSILGVAALFSLLFEQRTRGPFLGRWVTGAPSQNVWTSMPATTGAPRLRIIVCGHYDTQRTGWFWNGVSERFLRLMGSLPAFLMSPLLPLTLAMIGQVIMGIAALAGVPRGPLLIAAALLLIVYLISGLLIGQWAGGPYVPGAADNASGAAAVLSLGAQWIDDPVPNVELVLLLPGCEETGMIGAAVWINSQLPKLDPLPTVFLNLDGLGFGAPRFLGAWEIAAAGPPVAYPADLAALCGRVALAQGIQDAGPRTFPGPTDALAFLVRRIPGVTIYGSPDGKRLPNYHQPSDTCQTMDFDAAWRGVEFAFEVLRSIAKDRV